MKTTLIRLFCLLLTLPVLTPEALAQTTAFTYQGSLSDAGAPANGSYDFKFSLFDSPAGGVNLGGVGGFVGYSNAAVSGGHFTAPLDFGSVWLDGGNRWLEIQVRPAASGDYVTLTPRQQLTSAPYAFQAARAAAVEAGAIRNPSFIGTTGQTSLNFSANNQLVMRLEPHPDSPNIVAGYSGNFVNPGIYGVAIGGGGNSLLPNRALANYASVFGGIGNTASGLTSTAFGNQCTASGANSVAFGSGSRAQNEYAVAMGAATTASGSAATAMGRSTVASGYTSTAMGQGSIADGDWSMAMGYGAQASGQNSIALGYNTTASGDGSFALGNNTTVSGFQSTAIGNSTAAGGDFSMALGYRAKALHNSSFVWADGRTLDFASTAPNEFSIRAGGGMRLSNDTRINFGNQTRQMLNLYNADYGIGVQGDAAYFRTGNDFHWYRGGSHSDTNGDAGGGGSKLMSLSRSGQLDVESGQAVGQFTTTNNVNGAVLILKNKGAGSSSLGAINFDNAAGGVPGQISYLTSNEMYFRVGGALSMVLNATGLSVNGTFVSVSDRNAKENFAPTDARAVLEKVAALPVSEWNYKTDTGTRHIGPMAQDFYAAFNVGPDDKHIATVDADGVALAAIKGLNEKVESLSGKAADRLQKLEAENAELKTRLERLEKLLTARAAN